MVRVFAHNARDLGFNPIPKTRKMVLGVSLLNIQYYNVRIKSEVSQSWEKISALPYTLV